MKCIVCNEDMFTQQVLGLDIDLCPNCYGLWLNSDELRELTEYELAAGRILRCMKCNEPMQTKLVLGVEIDVCPDCSAVWLDKGELKNLANLDADAGRVLACPGCEVQLQTKIVRGVEVDVCPDCNGVYLDRGEMEKLSAIEPKAGKKTDIGHFLYDAHKLKVNLAIQQYKEGKMDIGKAAGMVGLTQEMFQQVLESFDAGNE